MSKRIKWGRRVIGGTFFGAFALFGLTALYVCVEGAWRGSQSKRWPTTEATIRESRVQTRTGRKGHKRHLVIEYHYRVGNRSLVNDKARYLDNVFFTGKREMVQRFPVGSRVPVYYDPHRPDRSVLVAGAPAVSLLLGLGVSGLMMTIGFGGIHHLARNRR